MEDIYPTTSNPPVVPLERRIYERLKDLPVATRRGKRDLTAEIYA